MKTLMTIASVVAVMAVAAFFVTKQVILPRFAPYALATEDVSAESDGADEATGEKEVYLVENLLVNPNGTSGKRYLSTSIGLEVVSAVAKEELAGKDLQVRDLLISILSARTVTQLTSSTEREQMRREIQARLNQLLEGNKLSAVYFVDYVMQ